MKEKPGSNILYGAVQFWRRRLEHTAKKKRPHSDRLTIIDAADRAEDCIQIPRELKLTQNEVQFIQSNPQHSSVIAFLAQVDDYIRNDGNCDMQALESARDTFLSNF